MLLGLPCYGEVDACSGLEEVYTPQPKYPTYEQVKHILPGTSYVHVFVEGYVKVKFTVLTDGTVKNVLIIESDNRPTRKVNQSMEGFLEINVVPTVSNWKYKPIAAPCENEHKFRYELADNV